MCSPCRPCSRCQHQLHVPDPDEGTKAESAVVLAWPGSKCMSAASAAALQCALAGAQQTGLNSLAPVLESSKVAVPCHPSFPHHVSLPLGKFCATVSRLCNKAPACAASMLEATLVLTVRHSAQLQPVPVHASWLCSSSFHVLQGCPPKGCPDQYCNCSSSQLRSSAGSQKR